MAHTSAKAITTVTPTVGRLDAIFDRQSASPHLEDSRRKSADLQFQNVRKGKRAFRID
jgi:hypothetical protein